MRLKDYRQLPNAAFETDQITGEGYRVLAAVQFYDRAGINGRGCDAAIPTIAERALCDIRTVKRWLARLVDMKLLTVEHRTGRGRANIYRVFYRDQDAENDQKGDAGATPFDAERVTADVVKGDSATIVHQQNHDVAPYKDTEGYSAKRERIRSSEDAPLLRSGANIPAGANENAGFVAYSDALSARIGELFPEDAPRFTYSNGAVNVGGFLAWADRRGRRGEMTPWEIDALLKVAEAVEECFDHGSPEYGVAYRIISSQEYEDVIEPLWEHTR